MTALQWAQWKVANATVRLGKLRVAMAEAGDARRRALVATKIAAEEAILAEQGAEIARLTAAESERFDAAVRDVLRRAGVLP